MKCVFIGYPLVVKGYRLWDRESSGFKVIISTYVVFDKYNMLCKNDNSAGTNGNKIEVKQLELPLKMSLRT